MTNPIKIRELFLRGAWLAMATCLGALVRMADASAHHSFAAIYDTHKPVELTGTIRKVDWINPHSVIHVVTQGAGGKETEWTVEVGTPNALVRAGLTRDSFGPGTQVHVSGFHARDGSNKVSGRTLTTADGRPLFHVG